MSHEIMTAPGDTISARPANMWRDAGRDILAQRSAQVGLVILSALFAIALAAPIIAVHEPNDPVGIAEGRPEHIFGVDRNGRDVFSRVVHGARVSLWIGFATVGFAIFVGTLLGSVAGFAGGWIDNLIMRLMDVLLAFPALVLAIAIVTVLEPGL